MASPVPTDDVFNQALRKCKENLSQKELAKICLPTSLAELLKHTEEITKGSEKARAKVEALYDLQQRIEPYHNLIQGVCKLAPKAGDLLWASIKFVLDVSILAKQSQ